MTSQTPGRQESHQRRRIGKEPHVGHDRSAATSRDRQKGRSRMRRIARLLPLVLLLAPVNAQAATTKATYVAAVAVSSSSHLLLPDPVGTVAPLGGIFVEPSGDSIGVKIVDEASATGIPYTVCQANEPEDTPTTCGEGSDDIEFNACSDGATKKTFNGVKPGNSVSIFIFSASLDCEGAGTVGTVTITH
jgi:hypothetical protein